MIVDKSQTKIVLRGVAEQLRVPTDIITRPKQRTSLPYLKIFYNSKYSEHFQNILLKGDALIKQYMNPDAVNEIVLNATNPKPMLALLNLEKKLQSYFGAV